MLRRVPEAAPDFDKVRLALCCQKLRTPQYTGAYYALFDVVTTKRRFTIGADDKSSGI